MTAPLARKHAVLFYGDAGVGKTALAVSSFWDWRKREPVEGRRGLLLQIGAESNPALGLPEEMVRRFPLPEKDPASFIKGFQMFSTGFLAAVRKAKAAGEPPPLTDLVIDGYSELNYLFVTSRRGTTDDSWEVYREWQGVFINLMQRFAPAEIGANLFATARIGEKRKAGKNLKGDPDWLDFTYMPALEGWAKHNAPNYHNLVLFLDRDWRYVTVDGKRAKAAEHVVHVLPTGEFLIKNVYEHVWLEHGWPPTLSSPVWADVEALLRQVVE